ncbi:hypothetical protein [Pseudoalteromonas aurantia]|nr:hypothetical protein [Pseudoalteromonas aurantia]
MGATFFVFAAVTLLTAALLYFLVERPVLVMRSQLRDKREALSPSHQ